jgi:hypothetical protein
MSIVVLGRWWGYIPFHHPGEDKGRELTRNERVEASLEKLNEFLNAGCTIVSTITVPFPIGGAYVWFVLHYPDGK